MHPGYFPVLFWSLLIFISFLGYGELLRRVLNRREFDDLGWGLKAAWGMAVVLAIGGLLMAVKLAIAPILTGVVIAGALAAIFLAGAAFLSKPLRSSDYKIPLSDLVLWGLAALAFASSIAWPHHIDPNDDLVCYLMLPKKILETGTLIEPFSFQRAGTFGGQSLLQALVMIVGGERNGHVTDRGMGMLIAFGVLLGATRGLKGQAALVRFILLFAFWFVPVPRISTNGAMVGGCLLLGMLATRERALQAARGSWTVFIPVALLMAGACSIRPTFTFVLGAIFATLAITELWSVIRGRGKDTFALVLRPYLVIAGVGLLVLLPYMAVLYASNGTPMVPPIGGFVSKAYQTYAFQNSWESLAGVVGFFIAPETLCIAALFGVGLLYAVKPDTRLIAAATFVSCLVILERFSALAYLDLYRYLYPILVPIALWFLVEVLRRAAQESTDKTVEPYSERIQVPVVAVGAVLAAFLFINSTQGGGELKAQVASIPAQIKEVKPFFDPSLKKAYAELQNRVPAGEKILTMVDASYLLDYKRNTIYSINAVGGSSPPPGIPFEQGPKALADYLKGLGIRYVIAVDFDQAVLLYTRKLWTETTRPEWFYPQIWRPRFLDVMTSLDFLYTNGGGVAKAGNVRLIDLGG